jgi:cytochrome c oxidase accessory protein FixG
MSSQELPIDRLATTDARGKRVYLYPREVEGKWTRSRSRLSVVLILFFLLLPWIRIQGHPVLLLDIVQRRFAVFGLTFWAHDTPLLFFVIAGVATTLFFLTSVWGRFWCGWGCPQTIFVEQVFRRIERWIEGDSIARRRRDTAPFSLETGARKAAKWLVFAGIALVLSHSFLAYFVGTDELRVMIQSSPAQNPSTFLLMAGLSLLILFDLGWFREQFCTVVCPYGRFQAVLMDRQSITVSYDFARGEPRRPASLTIRESEKSSGKPQGDCVNCYRCVQVCPTGIDIRRGSQLECVGCAACIDACDDVMSRLKKAPGLIRYASQASIEERETTPRAWYQRPRALAYLTLLGGLSLGLGWVLSRRTPIELLLIRSVDVPYQVLKRPDGSPAVLNHFKAEIRNQTFDPQRISLKLPPSLEAAGARLVISNHQDPLPPGQLERADLFIELPQQLLNFGKAQVTLQIEARSIPQPPLENGTFLNLAKFFPSAKSAPTSTHLMEQEAQFVGPLRSQ